MASLESFVNSLPSAFVNRYTTSGHLLRWGNELLEELQERGFLPTAIKETGCMVEDESWIDKPADLLSLVEVWNSLYREQKFRVEDVNNKFKLLDVTFDPDSDAWEAPTLFSAYAVDSIRITEGNILDKAADDLEDYLLLITAGTSAGVGIIISGNDATVTAGTGYTTLRFLHSLDAALSGTKITAAKLIPPGEYLMMKYNSTITEVAALAGEFPIPTDCEKRLIPTWLRWCCERQAMATSKETMYWQKEKDDILYSLQAARLNRPITPAVGRRLAGMENVTYPSYKTHPDYSEFV